ncbi:universal stress protein [Actinoplanes sp. TBRC 11911]|uniref:universal stress protein n=1 Tax=Actinoplanes sp. TBRC 11911 TaxID=2729386 RepID=UPI00145F4C1C|nr:universal stress protein [Actinoplanes sp. TBRC 11911]NMO57265.1 universal stress protein [Actinoplanes sp. TBRC 11911]
MKRQAIVVAADGTESSGSAVTWAAREAERRNLPLRVVHVFDWDWSEARYDYRNDYLNQAQRVAEAITGNAVRAALSIAPYLEIEGDPLIGHATARLLGESSTAEMLVLGSRGRGGVGSLLLGSVSQRVATHAACPVVVVRGRGDIVDGPVAVGVDDSPLADHVLDVAFEEAAGRGTAVLAVRSFPLWPGDPDVVGAEAEESARLDEQLAPWRDKNPDVPVGILLTHENPAATLVAASADAQLVVVGTRGRGVLSGTLIGSTGLHLLHHAHSPVYIARQRS